MDAARLLRTTRVGCRYGDFTILERIGAGGMGEVYCALQESLQREVAVKFISLVALDDQVNRKRFLREIKACSFLTHPSIIRIFSAGEERGEIFFAMDLLHGRTLGALMDADGMVPVPRAVAIAEDLLEALRYMHPLGFIHRDIKPANIFITTDDRHVLMDFGLVRIEGDSTCTLAGNAPGTPRYMPPEAIAGGIAGRQGDLYQVGLVLYQALTAQDPFPPNDFVKFVRGDLSPRPVPARHYRGETPVALDALLGSALTPVLEDRFGSADEMLEELRQAAAAKPSGRAARPVTRGGTGGRRWTSLPDPLRESFPGAVLVREEAGLRRFRARPPGAQSAVEITVIARSVCQEPSLRERLRGELEQLIGLEGDRLVPPLEVGLAGELLYLVERAAPGEPLSRRLAGLTRDEALALAIQLCDALVPLHRLGRPHGFLDPYTIRVADRSLIAITDLALLPLYQVGRLSDGKDSTLRLSHFSAPEQLDGQPVTVVADVFSIARIVARLAPPGENDPLIPVVSRACASVSERYPSLAALRSALHALTPGARKYSLRLAESPAAAPPREAPVQGQERARGPVDQRPPMEQRVRSIRTILFLCTLGLIGAGIGLVLVGRDGQRSEGVRPLRVSIEPGTFDARVSFETGVPWVAALECRAGEGPFVPVAAERPAAVRHRITVGSLRPAQSCELRFVLPDGTRSGSYRFSTLPLRLTWGPEDYRVRSVTVAFATDQPARCAVEYWPEESPARLVQSPPEESPATDHRAVLGLASPGQAHRIRVSAVLEDGTRTVLGNRLCQSLAGRCGRLRQELAPLDTVSLSAELARLEDTGADPGRTGQFAGRTTARHQKALTELLTLLPVALSEPSVKVDDKMLLYRIATPFLHLDAACESLKVPFSTGVTRALPSGFRPAAGAPPGRPWRAVGTPPSTGAWLVDRDATPVELVARGAPRGAVPRKECQLEIAVTGSGTSGGAAVVVFIKKQIHRRCESSLELALNGRAPLVLRPDCGNAAGPRPSIFHTFDPRLLVEGTNRVRLGLIPVPGLAGEPGLVGLERVEIWLSETSY